KTASVTVGQPAWAPSGGFTGTTAATLAPPTPASGQRTKVYQDWFVLERARLNVVYWGGADGNPEIHRTWAESHDDSLLFSEIIGLREAYAAGVWGTGAGPNGKWSMWVKYKQAWVPASDFNSSSATLVTPPTPNQTAAELKAYREWYIYERARLNVVYWGGADADPEVHRAWANAHGSGELFDEIMSIRSAYAAGVVGDSQGPSGKYTKWLQYSQAWIPAAGLTSATAKQVCPPTPPAGQKTKAYQDWYVFERARLNVVYWGGSDANPEVHRAWAESQNDTSLFNEIISLRKAYAAGVLGSVASPSTAYNFWKANEPQ
ncbi:MAG: hypothetical protein AAB502_05120, partial [Chloroflexota bacterium]